MNNQFLTPSLQEASQENALARENLHSAIAEFIDWIFRTNDFGSGFVIPLPLNCELRRTGTKGEGQFIRLGNVQTSLSIKLGQKTFDDQTVDHFQKLINEGFVHLLTAGLKDWTRRAMSHTAMLIQAISA